MKKIILAIPILALVVMGCNKSAPAQQQQPQQQQNNQNTAPVVSAQSQNYENQYLKITIPSGWTATEANKSTSSLAAVNITKGNYILYINTEASQASGTPGGRFAEIAMGAPSADAVVTVQPSPPCGTSVSNPAMLDHPRVDLYVNSKDNSQSGLCNLPKNSSTVWYFSDITDSHGDYFNYYDSNSTDSGKGYVITMAYNSKDVNSFPVKGSTELNSALADMTSIVKSLVIKNH